MIGSASSSRFAALPPSGAALPTDKLDLHYLVFVQLASLMIYLHTFGDTI
jgi:hypothetical protein